jgi:hypothetical protein
MDVPLIALSGQLAGLPVDFGSCARAYVRGVGCILEGFELLQRLPK